MFFCFQSSIKLFQSFAPSPILTPDDTEPGIENDSSSIRSTTQNDQSPIRLTTQNDRSSIRSTAENDRSSIRSTTENDLSSIRSTTDMSAIDLSSSPSIAVRPSTKKDKWNSAKKCLRPRIRYFNYKIKFGIWNFCFSHQIVWWSIKEGRP